MSNAECRMTKGKSLGRLLCRSENFLFLIFLVLRRRGKTRREYSSVVFLLHFSARLSYHPLRLKFDGTIKFSPIENFRGTWPFARDPNIAFRAEAIDPSRGFYAEKVVLSIQLYSKSAESKPLASSMVSCGLISLQTPKV